MTEVSLFVDGSCRGNPGPGGYCAIISTALNGTLQANGREKVLVGGAEQSTNNRMELTAVTSALLSAGLVGLQALKRPCAVRVATDSRYVVTILQGGRAKANRALVAQVRPAAAGHQVTAEWVAATITTKTMPTLINGTFNTIYTV